MPQIREIEVQDKNGNIYYPHTNSNVVMCGDKNLKETLNSMNYEKATGTSTEIILNLPNELEDGYWKKFIASADNNGIATTVNGKSLYKICSTNPPNLKKDRPYEIYHNKSNDCFFLKASATGTTSADKVLAGETFSTEDITDGVGTMPNKGSVTQTLGINGTLNLPKGYYDSIKVTQNIKTLSAKNYTPGTTNQVIAAGQYLTDNQIIKGDANLIAANIIAGKSIFGIAGNAKNFKTVSGNSWNDSFFSATDVGNTITLYCNLVKLLGYTPTMVFVKISFYCNGTSNTHATQKEGLTYTDVFGNVVGNTNGGNTGWSATTHTMDRCAIGNSSPYSNSETAVINFDSSVSYTIYYC